MIPFLGRSVYPGPALELRPSRTSFAGQARFHGWIVFTSWPRGDVEPLLPAELELAASTAAHDMHPVVFAFGEQTEGAVIFGGLTLPSAPGYHEFGMAVPFVKLREGRLLYVYVARMYATYLPAVLAGNAYYGFGKEMATMGWRGRTFLIDGQDHRRLLHADAEPGGSWSAGSGCTLTNFDAVRATFALPVVGRTGRDRHRTVNRLDDIGHRHLARHPRQLVPSTRPLLGHQQPSSDQTL